jgi:hypothetical protein
MTAATQLHLKVSVPDVWDIVRVTAAGDWTVAQLKTEALARATGRSLPPSEYIMKFRGARIFDETASLETIGVPDNASLIVLPARRRPVR